MFTDDEGGGPALNTAYGGTTPYSHLNGGLKRFRVAKNKNGKWVNTWMNADEASWINEHELRRDRRARRALRALLGSADPNVQRDQLLGVIAEKRTYLRGAPVARARRAPTASPRSRRSTR